MNRIWLDSYPRGVPSEIDSGQYRSLVHVFEESFRRHAPRIAFTCMGASLTYAELDAHSRQLAAWLQSRGLRKGARVAIMLPNVLQSPIALAAILRAGCTVVNVNPLYTPRELRHQLNDSGAEAIIILENFAGTLQEILHETGVSHVVVASMGEMLGSVRGRAIDFALRRIRKMVPPYSLPGAVRFRQALASGARLALRQTDPGPGDLAFLQYTGGTTGVSKGAALSHRNVVANLLQVEAWSAPALGPDPSREPLTAFCALPLYHIFALTACCLLGLRLGARTVLIPNPRDLSGLIRELGRYPVNLLPAVNTLFNGLVNHPDFAKLDFSGLKVCLGGGMAVQKAVAEKWVRITGCPIVEGYGLSETSPVAACNPTDAAAFNGSIGLPLPSTEIAILDDDGKPLPVGQVGEIGIRGPQVMAGYWNRPDETARAMTADGFFKSGDLGVMDERGYLKIVDRKKDMILVSGFNVYPNEIEDVVAMHPGVLECACVGVPDSNSGEAVKLFVVRKDPALTAEQLMEHCKRELTGYKRPRSIEFCADLPRSNIGKILRRELRSQPQAV